VNRNHHDARELRALASLLPVAPAETWERRARARCHAALAGEVRPRSALTARVVEAALVGAIGVYLASMAGEAVRLVSAG
jgi:hypothetical protein